MESSALLDTAAPPLASHKQISKNEMFVAIASLQSAFVVVCYRTDSILLVSKGLQKLVPALRNHEPWRACVNTETELLSAYDNAIGAQRKESTSELKIIGVYRRVNFQKINQDQIIISIQSPQSVADNLYEYMQVQDELFSASRTISVNEMATTLAHELNTPIGTISNILSGVKIRLGKPDISQETITAALDRALEQTVFSQEIISRVREFTHSRRPKVCVLDVRQQIKETMNLLDWLVKHHGCQVTLQLPSKPLYVSGDATMFNQVLINLIRNAVEAMQSLNVGLRRITITATQSNKKVTVSIADTGHGLSDKGLHPFVPFATCKSRGMGVGLNICRSFVELHQGRLWLSPNENEGCTSYVELPVTEQNVPEGSI